MKACPSSSRVAAAEVPLQAVVSIGVHWVVPLIAISTPPCKLVPRSELIRSDLIKLKSGRKSSGSVISSKSHVSVKQAMSICFEVMKFAIDLRRDSEIRLLVLKQRKDSTLLRLSAVLILGRGSHRLRAGRRLR